MKRKAVRDSTGSTINQAIVTAVKELRGEMAEVKRRIDELAREAFTTKKRHVDPPKETGFYWIIYGDSDLDGEKVAAIAWWDYSVSANGLLKVITGSNRIRTFAPGPNCDQELLYISSKRILPSDYLNAVIMSHFKIEDED